MIKTLLNYLCVLYSPLKLSTFDHIPHVIKLQGEGGPSNIYGGSIQETIDAI